MTDMWAYLVVMTYFNFNLKTKPINEFLYPCFDKNIVIAR